jgi:hypothetical protein
LLSPKRPPKVLIAVFLLNMPSGSRSRSRGVAVLRPVTSLGVMPVADGNRNGCTS